MIAVWIVLGLLALILMIMLVGTLMPERYEGRVQAFLAASPDDVWTALLDYDRHPMTGKMKKSVDPLPTQLPIDRLPEWVEDMGRGERITVRTVETEPGVRVVREMESAAAPMTSRWEYRLAAADGGCRLGIDAETFIRKGSWISPIFRVMMVVGGGVRKGLTNQVDMLAGSLDVTPQYRR